MEKTVMGLQKPLQRRTGVKLDLKMAAQRQDNRRNITG
jgi:hypothetical protein